MRLRMRKKKLADYQKEFNLALPIVSQKKFIEWFEKRGLIYDETDMQLNYQAIERAYSHKPYSEMEDN